MDHPDLLVLVRISIFTLMLDIGITLPFGHLTSVWRRPALLIRSLLAVLVLVPGVVLLLLWLLDLPRAVATGLAVLAAAPGAPLTTMRSQMAGGSTPYSASLQLTLALLAVLVTPLTLAIFHAMFVLETSGLPSVDVAREVAIVQFLRSASASWSGGSCPGSPASPPDRSPCWPTSSSRCSSRPPSFPACE